MTPAIGLGIRRQNRPILGDPAINGAEVTFEQADDPLRLGRFIGDHDFDYVSVHALKLSVACPEPPARHYLDALRAVADENGAAAVSDHLGVTRDGHGRIELGHFAPAPYTAEALDVVCHNTERIQEYFGDRPFFLENIAYLFRFRGAMGEAEFLRRVLERTGCGWLCDVTNVYANGRNFGYDPYAFISEVTPAASRVQMHLAGGLYNKRLGLYIDSHSRPIPDAVWDLYRHALRLGRDKVEAVFIERDQDFPNADGWRAEVRQARRIAEEATATEPAPQEARS